MTGTSRPGSEDRHSGPGRDDEIEPEEDCLDPSGFRNRKQKRQPSLSPSLAVARSKRNGKPVGYRGLPRISREHVVWPTDMSLIPNKRRGMMRGPVRDNDLSPSREVLAVIGVFSCSSWRAACMQRLLFSFPTVADTPLLPDRMGAIVPNIPRALRPPFKLENYHLPKSSFISWVVTSLSPPEKL